MGTFIFWIMFWFLIILLVFTAFYRQKQKKEQRRSRIRESFGIREAGYKDNGIFGRRLKLYEYLREKERDVFCLDDITVNDLGIRDIYMRISSRCVTLPGQERLYCYLTMLPGSSRKAEKTCDRIFEYAADPERSVGLQNILDQYGIPEDSDGFEMIGALRNAVSSHVVYECLYILFLLSALILTAFFPLVGMIATLIMICVCIWGYFAGKRHMDQGLKGLASCLRLIRCAKDLAAAGCDDMLSYKGLFSLLRGNFLISYKDQTTSDPLSIISDYIRMITHIDLIAYNIKLAGIKYNISKFESLYNDIGTLDALIAVASYVMLRKHCRAVICDEMKVAAKQIYHPLVAEPVYNDFEAKRGMLITGSNASGKSTFLKAAGINVLFARSLGIAFADSFETGAFLLYSSMALSDNLLGAQSYYVVEAESLKRICDAAKNGRCLCIIDEVLRGTNTVERIAASSRIIKYLCRPTVLCFVATHDLELSVLLGDDMDNYHFTENIEGDNVTFPFVIKKGSSDKTNAIRLLAMLGFDRNIVSSADELVERYKQTGKWTDEK